MKNRIRESVYPVNNQVARRCIPLYKRRLLDPNTIRIQPDRAQNDGINNEFTLLGRGRGVLFTLLSLASAISCTCYCDDVLENAIVLSWSLFIMCVIGFDSAMILCKWVSKKSRFLMVFCIGMCLGAWFNEKMIPAACILSVISGVLIYFKNSTWIQSEAWKMTATVENAMKRSETDSVSGSWLRHRNEARTMMHEAGYSMTDNELDSFVCDSWSLGYLHGKQSDVNLKKIQENSRAVKAENARLRAELDQRIDPDQRLIDRNAELDEALRDSVDLIKRYEATIKTMQADIAEYQARFERIEAMQEENPGSQEEPGKVVYMDGMSLYERILDSDDSVRKTAENLGCKPWQVQHARRAKALLEDGASIDQVRSETKLSLEAIQEIERLIVA